MEQEMNNLNEAETTTNDNNPETATNGKKAETATHDNKAEMAGTEMSQLNSAFVMENETKQQNNGKNDTKQDLKDQENQKVPLTSNSNQETGKRSVTNASDGTAKRNGRQPDGEEVDDAHKMVGITEIFKYSTCFDKFLMLIGSLAAAGNGAALPCMLIVFGEMIDVFVDSATFAYIVGLVPAFLSDIGTNKEAVILDPNILRPNLSDLEANLSAVVNDNATLTEYMNIITTHINFDMLVEMERFAIYYTAIGCGVLVLGYLQITCWVTAAERQSHTIRKKFFSNILRQEIGWFDTHESGEVINRLSDDINKVHAGIGDKVGVSIQWFSSFAVGFIIGFVYGWKLTLVIISVSPLLVGVGFLMNRLISAFAAKELTAYAKAGSVAEEVLGAIRTVVAFGGQDKELQRYKKKLVEARDLGVKKGLSNGLSMGAFYLVMYGSYALGFWYGCKLVREEPDNYTIGRVIIVFFSALMGAFSLGHSAPGLQMFSSARGAAYILFQLIDQVPNIDSSSDKGKKPDKLIGNVEFKNIHFTYPARQDVKILNGVTLNAPQGTMVALVGSSGCGKSTIMQLLQRFYDPQEGQVLIDGNDIRELNVQWLRQNIGIVGQEPILFATTIRENIRYGREGVTQEQIEEAASMANAHDFIMLLPDKYDTMVGDRGAQLSGGQKQRVAIARALVRDPRILLLDEATSALDTESEAMVQEALDKAKAGRTTIVIAHRLSTVKTADTIAGFQKGVVVEVGTHEELMTNELGIYSTLVKMQTSSTDDEEYELLKKYMAKGKKPVIKSQLSTKSTKSVISDPGTPVEEVVEEKKEKEEKPQGPFSRILRMNAPEWPLILIGCICAVINGGMEPVFAIIFSEIIIVFAETDVAKQREQVEFYAAIFTGIGVLAFITYTAQSDLFGRSGEMLTFRLRQLSFKAMLRQEIAWFDEQKNSTGILTSRLATDASTVQAGSGVRIGTFVQAIGNLGTGIIMSFIWGWKLALVVLAFLPIIAVAAVCEMKITDGVAGKNKEALEDAYKVATEAIENIRTVAGLLKERKFCELYNAHLYGPYKAAIKRANTIGLAYSISQGVYYFAFAAAFYYGAYLIQHNEMTFDQVMKVFSAIAFGGYAAGQATTFAPDAAKASISAGYIFKLLDREPPIDSESDEGLKLEEGHYTSTINFERVQFRYPTRPDIQILQGLSLFVEPGQTLALVGGSGCGKSTAVQLVERFYDPEDGDVTLDNYDLRDFNLQWLRSKISIVSQEPTLFDCSIAENIAYGDNLRDVPMDEIIQAARNANIHNFIESLPLGYGTNVGERGTQLSGGQKQRVAIARSLVRNPKILLLDEATSALDTESEKIVQEALDKASKGRTCIVIAHRLSTIQNADKICVLKRGKVYEEGTHVELMQKQGLYFKLQAAQLRQK